MSDSPFASVFVAGLQVPASQGETTGRAFATAATIYSLDASKELILKPEVLGQLPAF